MLIEHELSSFELHFSLNVEIRLLHEQFIEIQKYTSIKHEWNSRLIRQIFEMMLKWIFKVIFYIYLLILFSPFLQFFHILMKCKSQKYVRVLSREHFSCYNYQ